MKRIGILLLALTLAPAFARADLDSDIKAVLRDKALARAEVGMAVVRLGADAKADHVLVRHNSEIPLIPASNLKLVTTAAALDLFGHDFKFRTLLLKHNNDLVLVGDGDPTLGDADLLRKSGWGPNTLFQQWADQLKKRGLTNFDRVVFDDSVFDQAFYHPGWPAEQFHKHYCAQVGGLNFNANLLSFYLRSTSPGQPIGYILEPATKYASIRNTCVTGGEQVIGLARHDATNQVVLSGHGRGSDVGYQVTIHDPGMFAATNLAETMVASGVALKSAAPARDRTLRAQLLKGGVDEKAGWAVLGVLETPLSAALARANKDSINLYAESLCKRMGAESGEPGSWRTGTAAMGKFLEKVGVPATEYTFADGSGLSRANTVSASALCKVLSHAYHSSDREAYLTSLSVAGKDGTLETRFAGTLSDMRGRVFGKSGFINQVRTLSGYLKAKDGQWYAFSILMNNMADTATGKNLQEAILRAVDQHSASTK
ncbi:MAG TPA: D-alanyl-D-alanine carboxypeptidase/D-alanyl-D-alanine-endopeptidase [Tepidisphaeraceae bacterium]|nr:D-alanyl-D-alanine carboxypeptidase/D-alanyl-D-alanine-endopeptidase [Tepidisphaeraceae bacterium]